jgi:hypothetical protein
VKRRVYLAHVWLSLSRDALRRVFTEARGVHRMEALVDSLRYAKYALEAGDTWVEVEDECVVNVWPQAEVKA